MDKQLDKAQQRARQYWHEDGVLELVMGGLCLLLGLYFYFQTTLDPESTLFQILNVGMVLIVFGGVILGRRLVSYVKDHFTYPRTGFVSYRRKHTEKVQNWINVAVSIVMLVVVLISVLLINATQAYAWMPVVAGVVFGVVMLVIAYGTGLLRFYILAGVCILSGSGLGLAGIGNILGLAIFFLIVGVGFLISGGFTLGNYIQGSEPAGENSGA